MEIIPWSHLVSFTPIIRLGKHQQIVFYQHAMRVHRLTAVVVHRSRLASIIVHGIMLVIVHRELSVRF